MDFTHIDALNHRLSNERMRLANAKTEGERETRKVWVAQIEEEIAFEKKRLGIEDVDVSEMSDDDLLDELSK